MQMDFRETDLLKGATETVILHIFKMQEVAIIFHIRQSTELHIMIRSLKF